MGALEVGGGLVTGLNCVLSLVLAVRLLRLGSRTGGPEWWLGIYFVCGNFLSYVLSSVLYMGWGDPELAIPERFLPPIHAAHISVASLGMFAVYRFTWKAFYPDEGWARWLVVGAVGAAVFSFFGFWATEGFAVRVLNGWTYWIGWAMRAGALVFVAAASFHTFAAARRRLRLGLVEPLVVNRFLLWGVWGVCVFLMGASDPLARLWYVAVTGSTTVWYPEAGRILIVAVISLTSVLGLFAAATLVLTFFPTPAYRRWIASRQAVPTG